MDIQKQIERFKKGYPFRRLLRPATVGDGIRKLKEDESRVLQQQYEGSLPEISVCKFVPASGAASRMFRDLSMLRETFSSDEAALDPEEKKILEKFLSNAARFPFADLLEQRLGEKIENIASSGNFRLVFDTLLGPDGLGYGNVPKGLVPFHSYGGERRTAFCEHFREAIGYTNSHGTVSMHFTIPPAFAERFAREEKEAASLLSYEGVSFDVTYSVQGPETDTIAVAMDNTPVTGADGSLLKRPAGHGALLKNLNELSYDCIFVKNIDNVAKEELLPDTVKWKKILGGALFSIQKRVFLYTEALSSSWTSETLEREIISFCREKLFMDLSRELSGLSGAGRREFLFRTLHRPIRVCGVVKNVGEPGGGPFWVEGERERGESLQIVESAEVDPDSPSQRHIWENSTHFNPVDIVCGVKDFRGEKFNLTGFVDPEAGIITEKTLGTKKIKALELPGLWNGSMSGWVTVFVEVPSTTFNPVKTVWDLLKEPHQVE
ncbi:MAG: DUF4301 family protein [Candidatus Dadabacteria bacterium]|nr:DUF4301 family protein [Candidatus Dadabacteria bacterium]MDE0477047.1 DUF4301 family protein [Candidatus Dadabacteria bacterium]